MVQEARSLGQELGIELCQGGSQPPTYKDAINLEKIAAKENMSLGVGKKPEFYFQWLKALFLNSHSAFLVFRPPYSLNTESHLSIWGLSQP